MNAGFLPYEWKHIIFSWQMILIVIGIISLFSSESTFPGIVLLLIGGFFLIPKIADLPFNTVHLFWPALLIAIGVLIIFRRWPFSHHPHHDRLRNGDNEVRDGYVHMENIFSSAKQKIVQQEFRGGRINCIFGGAEIDLTQSTLASGVNELQIDVIFGGVNLIVPADWKIVLKNSSILGGFTDKRTVIKESSDASRMLVIKASTIFGGGELKSY
jgi:predicted membrane protein